MTKFTDAIAKGSERAQLEAMRDKLARAIEDSERGADVAALTRRLLDVLAKLKAVPDDKQPSAYDELAAKRSGGTRAAPRRQGGRRRRSEAP